MPSFPARLGDALRRPAVITVAVFLGFLALYVATLLPDVLPADAGEFQLVAAKAGVAHPPGYPLHTMLGWLFTGLPVGPTPAWRASLLSAVTAAGAVALVCRAGCRLSGSLCGGLAAALALGSATTVWATATSASIRPLMLLFTALCLHAAAEFGAASQEDSARADRWLVLFGAAVSLGLAHHPSLVFITLVCAGYLLLVDPALVRQPRRWVRPGIAFLVGLLVLAYLPLRSAAGAVLAPSDLATLDGFLDHFLARGFSSDLFAFSVTERMVVLPTLLCFQFNWPILMGAAIGAVALFRRNWRQSLLLVGSLVLHTTVSLTYRAPQTVEYLMPAYVPLALLLASCVGWAEGSASPLTPQPRWRTVLCWMTCALLLGGCLANLGSHLPSYKLLSESRDARRYAESLLDEAPENAAVLANWHWVTPLWYLQELEGLRPDVEVSYVYPQTDSAAQDWIAAIEQHIGSRPVVVTRYFEQEYAQLPYRFEPLGEAFLVRPSPRQEQPVDLVPLGITLGHQVELEGYLVEGSDTEPTRPLVLGLAWSTPTAQALDLSLFAQLIGSDGRLWSAARDVRHSAGSVAAGEVVLERFVVYPFLHAPPASYDLTVGAYLPGEPDAPRLTTQDGSDTVKLATVRVTPATIRPVTAHSRLAVFAGGPDFIGLDYDTGVPGQLRTYLHWAGPGGVATFQLTAEDGAPLAAGMTPELADGEYATVAVDLALAPAGLALLDGDETRRWNGLLSGPIPLPEPLARERYLPFGDMAVLERCSLSPSQPLTGDLVTLGLVFQASRPVERDYIVSAALTGSNPDGTWDWRQAHDTVPALITIPTLKWVRASVVFDPHQVPIPADATALTAVGSLGVYDHFTQGSLPPLDERLTRGVVLGTWTVGLR
jgi:hypothetical protein